jgi:hypothetical protein
MIRSCLKQTPKTIQPKCEPTEYEMTLIKLLAVPEEMEKLFPYGESNIARISLVDIVIHLSFEEKEFSKEFLGYLMLRISRIGYTEFPLYLMVIEALILLEDSLVEERILIFVANFIELTKSHLSQSYLGYSFLTDLFIKLALKVEDIHKRIQNEPEKFSHVEKWLRKHEYPSPGSVTFFKTDRFNGRRYQTGVYPYDQDYQQTINPPAKPTPRTK